MLTGAVVSTLLLVACVFLGIRIKDQAAAAIYRETTNTARLLLSYYEEVVSEIDSRLKQVAEHFEEKDFGDVRDVNSESELHKFLKMFSGPSTIAGPGIFDRSGSLVANASYFPVPKISVVERSIFRIHAENVHTTELYISPSVLSDNGCGFDAASKNNSAGGLNNMRKRATRISTGAKVSIQSAPGMGTTVSIELAFPPSPMG